MSGVPKSLRDFKKANNNNMQNTILNAKNSKQTQPNLSLDDVMHSQQGQPMPPQMSGLQDNPYQEQFRPQPEFMGQGEFPQALKPNFNDAFNQAKVSDITMPEVQKDNTSNQVMGEMDNGISMQPSPIPQMQPNMQQGNMGMQNIPVEPIQNNSTMQNVAIPPMPMQQKEERKVETNMKEDFKVQPYQHIQVAPLPERKANNKNIVAHVQEIEAEIDGLVNNTEAFLNNTKVLKIKILQTKTKEELKEVMGEVQETLKVIPESFIDAETRRRLRLCFSYLHKTKKELLEMEDKLKETQDSLAHLVSIDDVNELEEVILNIPATPTTDNVYEIRTFEINLINQLPVIKDELLRERISAVYNY